MNSTRQGRRRCTAAWTLAWMRPPAEGRADGALLDHLDRDGQGAGADQQRQVARLVAGEVAGDHRLAAADALLAGDRGSTWGEEITSPSSTMATRRRGSPGRLAGGLAGERGQRRLAVALEVDRSTCQRRLELRGRASAAASPTASPVRAGGPSQSRPPSSSASTRSASPAGGAVVAGSPAAGPARPSTGWKASWAVRPMTSTASLGS